MNFAGYLSDSRENGRVLLIFRENGDLSVLNGLLPVEKAVHPGQFLLLQLQNVSDEGVKMLLTKEAPAKEFIENIISLVAS